MGKSGISKKFTLVIPVAPERNVEIMNSIQELDYPKSDFDVIIVKGKNPSENRNKGAERAKGKIIVFLDDDAIIDKNYLKNLEKFFNEYIEIDVVGGVQLTPENDKAFAKISGYALGSIFGAWKISNRYVGKKLILNADETMLTSANLICKKEVMKKVKFDPRLFPGEDPKFIADAKEAGFNIAYNPELIIHHRRRPSIGGMIKQIFSYGKTRPQKESFFETLFKRPFFLIPSIFVLYLLILIFYSLINISMTGAVIGVNGNGKISVIFLIFILPLVLYIILSLFFSLYHSAKNKDYKAVFILPFIYLMIHLSYGTGFLISSIKKSFKKDE